jgi:hypothetical protein
MATAKLGIQRYFSRVETPKDNPEIERFNETLEYEWLCNCNLSLGLEEFNPRLAEWLNRVQLQPPAPISFAYLTPVEYIEREPAKIRSSVLPMWSTSTQICPAPRNVILFCLGANKNLDKGSKFLVEYWRMAL